MSSEILASERPSQVFRSSTFRRTLFGFLVVWVICGAALVILSRVATRSALLPLARQAGEESAEFLEEAASFGQFGPESEIFDDPIELDISPHFLSEDFLRAYVVGLREILQELAFENEDDEDLAMRRAIQTRLAILGHRDLRGLESEPIPVYIELMYEEIPHRHHEVLEEAILEHRQQWIGLFRSADELTGPEVAQVLEWEGHELLEILQEPVSCFELRTPAGEVLLTNLGESTRPKVFAGEFLHFSTTAAKRLDADELLDDRYCVVSRTRLADGSVLLVGSAHDGLRETLLLFPRVRDVALVGGLLASVLLSFLLARITVRFLADLSRASVGLQAGNVKTRIRRPGDQGDFDRAVSEINAMLEQLDSSVTTLTQVTDNIAHDLRTPLTRLQGQLDLLKRHPESAETMIEAVQDEANQLLATFNALLRIAQVESAQRRRSFRTIDLVQIVGDVDELYGPVFADAGLEFDLRLPTTPLRFFGDSNLWMQALSNLLDNALKYTPQGGRVDLVLAQAATGAVLEVRDTGPGIPEGEMENVFRRFYRLEKHRRERGTGLGLTLVAAICKLHGAPIELANEGGLVVRIRFPKFG